MQNKNVIDLAKTETGFLSG